MSIVLLWRLLRNKAQSHFYYLFSTKIPVWCLEATLIDSGGHFLRYHPTYIKLTANQMFTYTTFVSIYPIKLRAHWQNHLNTPEL